MDLAVVAPKPVLGVISEGAEARTAPAATLGQDLFRLAAETALDQGYLTPGGFANLMAVTRREGLK